MIRSTNCKSPLLIPRETTGPYFLQQQQQQYPVPLHPSAPLSTTYHNMCDSCACTHFSPHLWKAGECRDCHHPITSHAIVPTPEVVTRQVEIQPKNTHSFVGKLSHDKLEPFSRPEDQSLSGSGGTTRGGRNSTNLSTQYEPSPRLSINGRLQPIDEGPIPASRHRRTSSYNKPDGINNTMHRRTSSYGKPEGEGSPLAYEDRLSASYRKSREVQAKRKSISEAGGDHNEKEHHRSLIIEELVVTERDYCRDMDYLTQVCFIFFLKNSLSYILHHTPFIVLLYQYHRFVIHFYFILYPILIYHR